MKGARRAAGAIGLALGALILAGPSPNANDEKPLPVLGAELGAFPEGPMKALADQACLHCHSADMVRQQRLNEKQWTAEVNKMAGWGAAVVGELDLRDVRRPRERDAAERRGVADAGAPGSLGDRRLDEELGERVHLLGLERDAGLAR